VRKSRGTGQGLDISWEFVRGKNSQRTCSGEQFKVKKGLWRGNKGGMAEVSPGAQVWRATDSDANAGCPSGIIAKNE